MLIAISILILGFLVYSELKGDLIAGAERNNYCDSELGESDFIQMELKYPLPNSGEYQTINPTTGLLMEDGLYDAGGYMYGEYQNPM